MGSIVIIPFPYAFCYDDDDDDDDIVMVSLRFELCTRDFPAKKVPSLVVVN